jgi:hypothetical protein
MLRDIYYPTLLKMKKSAAIITEQTRTVSSTFTCLTVLCVVDFITGEGQQAVGGKRGERRKGDSNH